MAITMKLWHQFELSNIQG